MELSFDKNSNYSYIVEKKQHDEGSNNNVQGNPEEQAIDIDPVEVTVSLVSSYIIIV
jgi:hypothetical protein